MATSATTEAGRSSLPPASDEVRALLARATTPAERLTAGWLAPAADADVEPARWYTTWVRRVCDGDSNRAEQILRARGFEPEQWARAGGPVRAVPGVAPPGWVTTAEWLLDVARATDVAGLPPAPALAIVVGPGLPAWVDPSTPWRFFGGFAGWLDQAGIRLHETHRATGAPITAEVLLDLRWNLARRMLAVVGPILMSQAEADPGMFGHDPGADWWTLWNEYPVVARLLATCWRQWEDASTELIERIATDLPDLAPAATVVGLELGAGDRHGDGRSVAAITLDTGERWFYKPKAAGPERMVAAVFASLDACEEGAPGEPLLGLRLPVVHQRDGYCWTGEVVRETCTTTHQVGHFFHRAGAALRVLQVLGATDLHHENFVPTADQPVLVDTETAVGPGSGWAADAAGSLRRDDPMADTPAATSMVTSKVAGPPGRPCLDIGALAGPETLLTPYDVAVLEDSAAGPRLGRGRVPASNGAALPQLGGELVGVHDHLGEVLSGYARAHVALRDHDIIENALAGCSEAAIRFVARPTQVYVRLLQSSLSAEALRDGAAREMVLERLWRAFGTCPPAVIEAEQAALRDLDVPLFTLPVRSADLTTDRGVVIGNALAQKPADEVTRRLASLRTDDPTCAAGLDDLRAALFCALPGVNAGWSAESLTAASAPTEAHASAVTGKALALLCDLAHADPVDGHPRWYGLDFDSTRNAWRHRRYGPGLNGEAGIGLALVTASALLPSAPPQARELGIASLTVAATRVRGLRVPWEGGDAHTGPAGVLYAVATATRLPGADPTLTGLLPELIDLAVDAARHPRAADTLDAANGALRALAHLPPDTSGVAEAIASIKAHLASQGPGPSLAELEESPSSVWWQRASAKASTAPEYADLAWRARACWHRTASGAWRERFAQARLATFAMLGRRLDSDGAAGSAQPSTNSVLSGQLAPDSRSLSVVHGLAGVVLLGCATHDATPDVRSFE